MTQGVEMLDQVSPTCCRYILSDLLELAGYEPRERSNVAITGIQTDVSQVCHSGLILVPVECLSGLLTRHWRAHSSALRAYASSWALCAAQGPALCKKSVLPQVPCHTADGST